MGTDSVSDSNSGSRLIEAGEVAGDYSKDWRGEFNNKFVWIPSLPGRNASV